ncbi:MAG: CAP domain-containing protein [Bacillota bacterium]
MHARHPSYAAEKRIPNAERFLARGRVLYIAAVLAFAIALIPCRELQAYPARKSGLNDTARLLALVNEARAAASLPSLEIDEDLCEVAMAHAKDMALSGFFGHVSPNNGTLAARARKAGVSAGRLGENLAGNTSVADAHEMLMRSPSHKGNILDKHFTRIGIAVYRGGRYGLMIVEVFASDPPENAAADADAAGS